MVIGYCIRRGIMKEECEDAVLVNNKVFSEGTRLLESEVPSVIAIADGVGGSKGGRIAATYLLSEISKREKSWNIHEITNDLIEINSHLIEKWKNDNQLCRMATTYTGIYIGSSNRYYTAHCGNTRAYVINDGYLYQLTEDHTAFEYYNRRGNYDIAERCNKNELVSVFGAGDISKLFKLTVAERKIKKTTMFLITTDGIHDYLSIEEIEQIMRLDCEPDTKAKKLCEEAINMGSLDDCSAIIAIREV